MVPRKWAIPVLLFFVSPCRALLSSFGVGRRVELRCSLSLSNNAEGDISQTDGGGNITVRGSTVSAIDTYSAQAQKLRAEIRAMETALVESKKEKLRMEKLKVEQWMERLLVNQTYGEGDCSTQILNSVEQVAEVLKAKRYSPEQVDKIFRALTRGVPRERIEQSLVNTPLLALLVEACGELDQLEREDNPNRRWNGRMERDLRRRLFAMEWGINPDDLDKKDE